MFTRTRTHIRSNLIGYVALFFSLSLGTAWALERNSVKSRHIAPDAARGVDVDEASLSSAILQRRIGGNCEEGQAIQSVGVDGTVTCEAAGQGPPGTPGADAASALTGRVDLLTTGTSVPPTVYGAPNGTSTPAFDEFSVTHRSPNATIVARDLVVTAKLDHGGDPGDATFTLRDDGADTAVSCTMPSPGTISRCDSGEATASISPGSRLSLQISATGGLTVDAEGVEFGWRATTP